MPLVSDPLLPAVEQLLGPGAGPLLATVVEAGGGSLVDFERRHVTYRPGDRAAVRFRVRVRWGDDVVAEESVVAVTTADGPPDGTLVLSADDIAVGLFRYPYDPALPGLPVATFGDRLEDWLRFGGEPLLEVRSYRPTRRAVVHARWTSSTTGEPVERYVKCVPPAEAAAIEGWLATLRGFAPVPVVAEMNHELGMLALEALPGRTIRQVLLDDSDDGGAGRDALPGGEAILELLDRLPRPVAASGRARPGPIRRAAAHADLIATVVPGLAPVVATLVNELWSRELDAPEVIVHGDLYEAQILVADGRVSGLLDLDGAGRGRRVDDLATFLAHLQVLADAVPRRRGTIALYEARLRPAFEAAVGRSSLAASTAAALVGLATGPFRVQQANWPRRVERRVALARRWADVARSDRGTRVAVTGGR